jgi:uncharacterized protein YjiS (DUF1127 family)
MAIDAEMPAVIHRTPDGGTARRCLEAIRLYLNKRRERLALSLLREDELRDIGLTPSEARAEVAKSWFWA